MFVDADDDGALVVTDATALCNCVESVALIGELYDGWNAATYQLS
eukprot:SAG22_NODE_8376_length_660_cov_1.199643_1_plen_45_part_00